MGQKGVKMTKLPLIRAQNTPVINFFPLIQACFLHSAVVDSFVLLFCAQCNGQLGLKSTEKDLILGLIQRGLDRAGLYQFGGFKRSQIDPSKKMNLHTYEPSPRQGFWVCFFDGFARFFEILSKIACAEGSAFGKRPHFAWILMFFIEIPPVFCV